MDVDFNIRDADYALEHLDEWMKQASRSGRRGHWDESAPARSDDSA